jgi:hypothetical protein
MSKMDNLRAMREAKYAEAQKRAGSAPARLPAAVAPAAPAAKKLAEKPAPAAADPSASEALCGHRNMSGRTCTREAGHAAKSHRYS